MISHGYFPTVSGVTLVVQRISQAMVRRGHQVTVIAGSERKIPYEDEDQGVHLVRVRSWPNPFWKEGPIPYISPGDIKALAARFQPDVIHIHENALLSYQLLRVKWDTRPPLVSSCYYVPLYVAHYLHFGKLVNWFEAQLWKYAVNNLNQFDHVVFCTRTHEQYFMAHGLQVPTTVISNGVDTNRYRPLDGQDGNIEQRYALPRKPRILFVGRLAKDKKIDLLIQAISLVCAERPAHLVLVGRGDERASLERLIRQLNMEKNVHLLGYVPEEDLPAIYRASDLFAVASTVEVQNIPALQAVVTGLPIVAANSAALPELVRDGENGYLVPPLDAQDLSAAILRILNNPGDARRMGQASLAIGQAHAADATFEAYENFYHRLASHGSSTTRL